MSLDLLYLCSEYLQYIKKLLKEVVIYSQFSLQLLQETTKRIELIMCSRSFTENLLQIASHVLMKIACAVLLKLLNRFVTRSFFGLLMAVHTMEY